MPLRAQFHPRIQEVLSLPDFIQSAASGQFEAVILHRQKAHPPGHIINKVRENVRAALNRLWESQFDPSKNLLIPTQEIKGPDDLKIKIPELASFPALRTEFNLMAQTFEKILGINEMRLSLVQNSNNPMPTRRVRNCPAIFCEWFSHNGYVLDPDGDSVTVQSGNWIFATPEMAIDILDKNFTDSRMRRLTTILEPA